MASTSKSRWADDDPESTEVLAQRKKEKEERKRLKEEKLRKQQENSNNISSANPYSTSTNDNGPPAKRQKISESSNEVNTEEGAHLLNFPTRSFGACRDVELYELLNNIEEGSYGFVSRARYKRTGEVVALKRLKLEHANDGFPVTGLREIQTLKACDHQHIVQLREIVVGNSIDVYLVLDFIEHDLKTLLEDNPEPFLPSEIKTLILQITSATEYLHDHYILHRDLKTSNLLLNNRGEIKLADFGMARYTSTNPPPQNLTQLVVTLWYRAPELLLGTATYAFEIDIWSLGCIFAELLTRDPLFQGKNEVDQLSKIFSLLGTPTRESWPGFRSLPNAKALHPVLSSKDTSSRLTAAKFAYLTTSGLKLLASMLSLNPDQRPTAGEILSHGYFKEDPRPKPTAMFPTFPSKAGQERRRKKVTPNAPGRGNAPELRPEDFAGIFGGERAEEMGAGFALRMG